MRIIPVLAAALALPLLASCGDGTGAGTTGQVGGTAEGGGSAATSRPGDGAPSSTGAGDAADRLRVVASFYPLQFLVERVAGEHAEVSTLTAAGVDPHEVELTPRTVASLGGADLVLYQSAMQPAVDDAVTSQAADRAFDVTPVADLLLVGEDAHEDHGDHDGHGHEHGPEDPHFWLDPLRYADVAEAIGGQLAQVDPDHETAYRDNTSALVTELEALDQEFVEGLSSCESQDVVTTHDAFGYLGHRYDLHLIGIGGISADTEPSPARLAEVAALVDELGVGAVYTEPLLPRGIAETVARETGTQVLVLDPVEGITDASAGDDYVEVMRANLQTLREGLGCR